MNKTMRTITVIVGVVLLALGIYEAFVPQEIIAAGPLEVSAKKGLTTESIIIMALGVLALIASFYKRE